MDAESADPATSRRDRRLFLGSVLGGVALGAGHGVPMYGVFSVGNVAMIGLGVILVLGVVAGVVALMPARPAE
jgi:hypothetical protein